MANNSPSAGESGRITTHYSQAELGNLIEAAEKVCGDENSRNHIATPSLKCAK